MEEDLVKEHLNKLDVLKSMGPNRLHPQLADFCMSNLLSL